MKSLQRNPAAKWLTVSIMSIFGATSALAAAPVPGAGDLLQQIPQPSPAPSTDVPPLQVQPVPAPGGVSGSTQVNVQAFNVEGNTVLTQAEIDAQLNSYKNRSLTLDELNLAAIDLTAAYQAKGYSYTRVIVPPQELSNGVVTLRVLEARYGTVTVKNNTDAPTAIIGATAAQLKPGQLIEQSQLNRQMLIVSDIPGVNVQGTLQPGAAVGEADLLLGLSKKDRMAGSGVRIDNAGGKYTGRPRLIGNLVVANPFGMADQLTLTGLTSGSKTNYGRIAYEAVVNGAGSRLGGAYSYLDYKLGNGLENLGGHGTAEVLNVFGKMTLQRSQNLNTYQQFDLNFLKLRDSLDAPQIFTDRDITLATYSWFGDSRVNITPSAITQFNLNASVGDVKFRNAAASTIDAAGADTSGSFFRGDYEVSHLMLLSPQNAIYASLSGQLASKNLDSSQKMLFTGINAVRAYDTGVVSGDRGNLLSLEFRRELGSMRGAKAQALVFADMANFTINQRNFSAAQNNGVLRGAGVGLNLSYPGDWLLRLMVSTQLGHAPGFLASEAKTRGWAVLSKSF